MDGSPPRLQDSTPTQSPSRSSTTPDTPVRLAGIPLSIEAFEREVRRRKAVEAGEHADEIRARCKSFHAFVKEAWPILEPRATFVDNWHIKLICDHLEAVTHGEINRLLINVWPGSMKSLLVSVLWQAWEWGPCGLRSIRYLTTAFNDTPVKRDSRKCRDLILSEWYQKLWPSVKLKRTGERSFANTDTGTREGVAFGSLTSQRGDRLLVDDPHSTELAESDVDRAKTTRKFKEGAINRLNDQAKSAIVVIMQRLHQDDISGLIMKLGWHFVHVILPLEFEPARAYRSKWGSDPRTKEGEIADPRRFPPAVIKDLKESGEYFWNGQYQQRPAPREGGLFKVAKLEQNIVEACPPGGRTVGGWDLAGSKRKKSPYSVRVKMTRIGGDYYVRHVDRRRTNPTELNNMVHDVTVEDGPSVTQSIPQDPGQAGKGQVWSFADLLAGFVFEFSPESGDKEHRAMPYAAQVGAGRVFLVRGDWNHEYIEELRNFPAGSYKDQVDASSRAFMRLVGQDTEQVGTEYPEVVEIETVGERLQVPADYDPWA